jgi:5'-nucleotidase
MILRNFCVFAIFLSASIAQNLFPLSIIHLNDMHAKFEETNLQANTCKNPSECIGGYARVVHMLKELKANRPNVIYMNAADNFQGTLWYIMFRWNVTQHFLNLLPADVMVKIKNIFKF